LPALPVAAFRWVLSLWAIKAGASCKRFYFATTFLVTMRFRPLGEPYRNPSCDNLLADFYFMLAQGREEQDRKQSDDHVAINWWSSLSTQFPIGDIWQWALPNSPILA